MQAEFLNVKYYSVCHCGWINSSGSGGFPGIIHHFLLRGYRQVDDYCLPGFRIGVTAVAKGSAEAWLWVLPGSRGGHSPALSLSAFLSSLPPPKQPQELLSLHKSGCSHDISLSTVPQPAQDPESTKGDLKQSGPHLRTATCVLMLL